MKTNTFRKPTPFLCAMLMALPLLTSCQQQKTQVSEATPASPKTSSPSAPVYPVKVSANHRYLVDQNNVPFLIVGDTPQGLISRLNEKEIDDFLADRQAHGFNTMGWIDVALCRPGLHPTNILRRPPLTVFVRLPHCLPAEDHTDYDLSTPNEALLRSPRPYRRARGKAQHTVFLDPIETAGWFRRFAITAQAASAYGRIPRQPLQEVSQCRLAERQRFFTVGRKRG